MPDAPAAEPPETLAEHLASWMAAGLIDADQAAGIARFEAARAPHDADPERPSATVVAQRRGPSAAAEVAGYAGATLALVGAGILLADFWDRVTTGGQVALLGLVTVVLLVGGWSVGRIGVPASDRLASALWAGAVLSTGLGVGIAADEALPEPGDAVALVASACAALMALVLQRLRPASLQVVALAIAVGATALTAVTLPGDGAIDPLYIGLLVWALGVACVLLGAAGWLDPPATAAVMGLAGALIGCQIAVAGEPRGVGLVLALGTTAALIVLAARARSTVLAATGMIGLVAFVPQAVVHFVGDSIGAPLLLLLIGLLLVVGAVGTAIIRDGGRQT